MNRRYLKISGIALIVVFVVGIVAQIVAANTGGGYTAAYKDGELGVPATKTLRLPAGSLDVSLRGFQPVHVPAGLGVTVTAIAGGAPVGATRDVGEEFGPTGRQTVIAYRRVFKENVPAAGEYRVVTTGPGGDNGLAVVFGHAPAVESQTIWAYTGIALLVVLIISGFAQLFARLRRPE